MTLMAQSFSDHAEEIGIDNFDISPNYGCGVNLVDVDNNGFLDVFLLSNENSSSKLYLNDGTTWRAPIEIGKSRRSRAAAWFDYNGDKILDVVIVSDCLDPSNCLDYEVIELFEGTASGAFVDVSEESGITNGLQIISQSTDSYVGGIAVGDVNLDGFLDVLITRWGGETFLYLNGREGTFENRSDFLSIPGTAFNYQAAILDFSGDGWPEILIARDALESNVFLENLNGQGFKNIAEEVAFDHKEHDMGMTIGDFDNDQDFDVYVSNIEFINENARNALFVNESTSEGVMFRESANQLGIGKGGWGWGVSFFEANNDGWADLAATNGWEGHKLFDNDSSKLWINEQGAFVNRSLEYNFTDTLIASSLLAGDVDRDGDMDLIQGLHEDSQKGVKLRYLKNSLSDVSSDANYIVVQPRMQGQNHWAIGSKVTVESNDLIQTRPILAGSSFYGQEPSEAYFGLGATQVIDRITVTWPGGEESSLENINVNQILVIQDEGVLHRPVISKIEETGSSDYTIRWGTMSTAEIGFVLQRDTTEAFSTMEEYVVDGGSFNYVDATLMEGVEYFYRVRSFSATDSSKWSDVSGIKLLESIESPELVSANYESLDSVLISWQDNSNNEDGFIIRRSTDQDFDSFFEIQVDAQATSFVDSNLEPNVFYYYQVLAYNDFGATSLVSNTLSIFTEVDLPVILGVSEGKGIEISPNPSNDGVLRIMSNDITDILVYDLIGNRIPFNSSRSQDEWTISFTRKGFFILEVHAAGQPKVFRKIIIE